MNVKSLVCLAAFTAMLSGSAIAQNYAPVSSAIRSATFGGPEGLGVLPTAATTNASALGSLQLSAGSGCASGGCASGGCASGGCASGGCASDSCGISCTSPVGCTDCGDIGCGGKCGCVCPNPCRACGPCGWMHKVGVFGEFLYLRARNAEVPYAVVQNSNLPLNQIAPIQVSPYGIVDPDFEPAFRGGFAVSLGSCSSFTLQYTMFESTTSNELVLGQKGVGVIGLLGHPGAQNTATSSTQASAEYDISFDLIDADYRELLSWGPSHRINYLLGASYGNLEQQLRARNQNNGTETVFTDIDFNGAGLRLGLEGERFSRNRGMITYFKAISTILAGEFNATYFQGQDFDNSVVDTAWEAGRIVPVLEMEAGVGWSCHDGAYRVTAGYNFSAWFNTVKTDDWIRGVQQNNLTDLGSTMTFDGLVTRIEARF